MDEPLGLEKPALTFTLLSSRVPQGSARSAEAV